MPWTYNTIGYGGNKIGSLYGVLTYISEYRTATDDQREEIGNTPGSKDGIRYHRWNQRVKEETCYQEETKQESE